MSDGNKITPPERRHRARTVLHLPVRYLLENRRECMGSLTDASESGLALLGPERAAVGATVIVYVDGIGRFDGQIVRHFAGGFAIELGEGSPRSRDRIARLVERQRGT
jgi:hypothetical protein